MCQREKISLIQFEDHTGGICFKQPKKNRGGLESRTDLCIQYYGCVNLCDLIAMYLQNNCHHRQVPKVKRIINM
jgi:hypothetical protein